MTEAPRFLGGDDFELTHVVAIAAHPDDLDFGAAGTIARLTQAGVHVEYCLVTNGDAGGFDESHRPDIERMRQDEQRAAAARVGVADVHFLGERDGYVAPTLELQKKIVALLRQLRPQVVLAHHPERNWGNMQSQHPDHLSVGEAVVRASYPALENPFAFPELQAQGLEAYRLRELWLFGGPEERENHFVDISSVLDKKHEALMAHLSQHPDPARMMDHVNNKLVNVARRGGQAEGALSEAFHAVTVNGASTISGF
ncbi:PIG-L deacetylase family protein [Neomicrococcus aestuarii]|uniref:PIG-L domain-containing protein n=1 Tax=Neomicrococcus aestuarii TaxID=556325 RepID=A0A1L2ZJX8_9MICC|nr:PIG-L deacetylase family protein [Neomicrococcus aestuarii]APF39695.1 PIG-L domain-containing protein [Neomicrococcus aestuarii]